MLWNDDPLRTRNMAPQAPLPPEIEGYLKKLKRKTSNLTGGWNKRWFFVDPKRLEFGYSKNKAPNAAKSSIYLNDITAVLQFDDTHFQVESRTRNFFLCGESKASTTCWVKSLDEYRKKLIEYEKDLARLAASIPTSTGNAASTSSTSGSTNQAKPTSSKKTKKTADPARDSQDTSSSLSVSASSSSNLAEEKTARYMNIAETVTALDEPRSPSPIEAPRRHERRESKQKNPSVGGSERPRERDAGERDSRGRGREKHEEPDRDSDERERERRGRERPTKDRDRERERDRDRDRDREADDERSSKRDRSTSYQRRTNTSKQTPATGVSSRTSSGRGAARPGGGHPTHGYVMHAWMDEYD